MGCDINVKTFVAFLASLIFRSEKKATSMDTSCVVHTCVSGQFSLVSYAERPPALQELQHTEPEQFQHSIY